MVEIHRQMTEVYGSDVMSIQMVRKWCREFHDGRGEMHDESRTGYPKVVMDKSVNTIRTVLNEDHCLTLQELETIMNNDLGDPLPQMLIYHIVTEKLGFRKVCVQWVPHQSSLEHKINCMAATLDFLTQYERDGEEMLSRTVTGDETWVHHFTLSTKKKSLVWKEHKEL